MTPIRNILGRLWRAGMQAAVALPPVEMPKSKQGQRSVPGFLKAAKPAETALQKTDRRVATTDPTSFRYGSTTQQTIRDLTITNADLSASVSAYLRVGIPEGYTLVAKNPDGTFNAEATNLAHQIHARMNLINDYQDGFSGTPSLRTVSEMLARELIMYGACSMELVLDKSLLPKYFSPVAVTTVEFIPDKASQFKFVRPVQKVGGEEIDLDVPTFFYVSLDQLTTDFTPVSPLESAVQPSLFSMEFMNDIRRIVRRVIHPRMNVSIKYDVLRSMAPLNAQQDPDEMRKFEAQVVESLSDMINGLAPEDALVNLDFIEIDYLNNGNISLNSEYQVLSDMANAKMATGAKVLPSILGHGTGTQNVASAEALIFMKTADGSVRLKLNEILSRAFTLALRLMGQDVQVEFRYDDIDLRPASELEAFRQVRQSRVLDLLSLGFISDEEASIELSGKLPPPGFKPLSGTGFRAGAGMQAQDDVSNPYSGTSVGGGQSGGGAANQGIKSDQPKQAGPGRPAEKK